MEYRNKKPDHQNIKVSWRNLQNRMACPGIKLDSYQWSRKYYLRFLSAGPSWKTNKIPTYQFLQGGSLVFSQMYNGDIEILVLFPALENSASFDNDMVELDIYEPKEINEKLINF